MSRRSILAIVLVSRAALADVPPPIFPAPTPAPTPTQTPNPDLSPNPDPSPNPNPSPTAPTVATPPPTTTTPTTTTTTTPTPDKPVITDEEEGPPKLSLPTEADRQAWLHPGFRLGLGLTYGEFHGLRGAPSGRLLGPKLRVGLRLDEKWSVIASFEYTAASRAGGLAGLRFAGTLDPTWHVTPAFSLAVGFGFGGIVEDSSRMDATPLPSDIQSSYTFPDASTPIKSCSGVGAATLIRGEYAYVLGPRTEIAVGAEAIGQWTGCVDDSGHVEPDTGKAIERHQWWPHVGATLTVGITWR